MLLYILSAPSSHESIATAPPHLSSLNLPCLMTTTFMNLLDSSLKLCGAFVRWCDFRRDCWGKRDHCPSCVNSRLLLNNVTFALAVTARVTRLCWFGFKKRKKEKKESRMYRRPAKKPQGCLSLPGIVSGVAVHQSFILDLTRPRGDTH